MGRKTLKKAILDGLSNTGQSQPPSTSGFKKPKRGRPRGINRVPLTKTEKLARKAQLEMDRRVEKAQAIKALKQASGCAPGATEEEMVKFVTRRIKDARQATSLEELQRINTNLAAQIASCVERLGPEGARLLAELEEDAEDANMEGRDNVEPERVPAADPSAAVAPQPDTDTPLEKLIPLMFSPEELAKIHQAIDLIQPNG